jgi:hypothetical protein
MALKTLFLVFWQVVAHVKPRNLFVTEITPLGTKVRVIIKACRVKMDLFGKLRILVTHRRTAAFAEEPRYAERR